MTDPVSADLIERLGQAIIERAGQGELSPHLFLYFEVEPGVLACSLYRVSDDKLVWVNEGIDINNLIYDLWHIREYGKRWRGIAMEIKDNRFAVSFDYPEGPYPPEDYSLEYDEDQDEEVSVAERDAEDARMRAAVTSRFGDRPIVYPTEEEVLHQQMLDNANYCVEFDLEPPSPD